MASRYALALVAVLLTSLATTTTATPPRPGTERNGLTPNETASLWSRDSDDYITQSEYEQRYGDQRSAMAQVANGTDITYKRPPQTAATWTQNDFQDLTPGNATTSIHPLDAELTDGTYIQDTHASIFAIQPATRAHRSPGETPLYVAPSGTVRGLVDYRVRTGNNSSIVSHEVEAVRLLADGTQLNATANTQTPTLGYQLAGGGQQTVTLEAVITARVRTQLGNQTNATVETERVTVRDSIDVTVYDLRVETYHAEYPDGDSGVAVFQSLPWQGYTLTANGSRRVRGVWRFYTARDTTWDTLVRSTATNTTRTTSPALPLYVHAYPSRIGPRAEPVRIGPDIVDVWGPTTPAPPAGENIHIDSVSKPYTASYGLALRSSTARDIDVRVAGIVRGENATIVPQEAGSTRRLRNSTLTATVINQSASRATIHLELTDAATGDPIMLASSPRTAPLDDSARDGYLVVDGARVQMNSTGVATITLEDPGVYTVRYEPGSWTDHNPAYVSDTTTVRWHPLTTLDGWLALATTSLWYLTPFLVTFYLGHRIHRLLTPTH